MKKIILMAAVAMLAASCGTQKEAAPVKKEMGVELYNIRKVIGNPELYAQNHVEAFKTLAEMGYTAVEAAGNYNATEGTLYGVSPEQFKADVEAAGLKVMSSHVGKNLNDHELATGDFSHSLAWWDKCIDVHKRAGVKYIVTPSFKIPDNLKDLKTFCDYFNAIGAKCKAAGIQYGYHNQSREFNTIEDKVIYDFMLENTDPELVFFQMDVYWACRGQAFPVEYFRKYPGRFKMLHIKDHYELGESGMVGFDAIFKNADVAGLQDYIVELEGFTSGDWKVGHKICADYLLNAPFVKESYAGGTK